MQVFAFDKNPLRLQDFQKLGGFRLTDKFGFRAAQRAKQTTFATI